MLHLPLKETEHSDSGQVTSEDTHGRAWLPQLIEHREEMEVDMGAQTYRRSWQVPLVLLVGVACQQTDYAETPDASSSEVSGSTANTMQQPPPDTTADGMWAHLTAANYRETWQRWPGTVSFYEGADPHGMLLTTFVNQTALGALSSNASEMPTGAVIVKENYSPDSTLAAVTVMYKRAGYNPDHNDWFFLKRLADNRVEASGRVVGCQTCHGLRADNDYIMTDTLGTAGAMAEPTS